MLVRMVALVVLVAGFVGCRDFSSEYSRDRTKVYFDKRNFYSGRIVGLTDSTLLFQRDPLLPAAPIGWREIDRVVLYNDGSTTGPTVLGAAVGMVAGAGIGFYIPARGFFDDLGHAPDGFLLGLVGGALTGYLITTAENSVTIRRPSDLQKLKEYVAPR